MLDFKTEFQAHLRRLKLYHNFFLRMIVYDTNPLQKSYIHVFLVRVEIHTLSIPRLCDAW